MAVMGRPKLSYPSPGTQSAQVLQAVRDGAETVREVHAVCEGLTAKAVAAHLIALVYRGYLVRTGWRQYPDNHRPAQTYGVTKGTR